MKKPTLKERLADAMEENNWLKIEVKCLEDIINPPPPPPTHTDQIQHIEKCLNEDVNRLAQECYDKTGKIPTIQVFIDNNGVAHRVPVTEKFKIDSRSYQTDAVTQLIEYCRKNGTWGYGRKGEKDLYRWLNIQIKDHLDV